MPDNLDVLFHVHERNDDGSMGTYYGGGSDDAQAVAVACAVYTARQAASTSTSLIIAVVDDAGSIQAWIGKSPVQVGE